MKRRRLNFSGYMLIQKNNAPVRKGLAAEARVVRRPQVAPKKIWYFFIKKNLERLDIKIEDENTWCSVLDRSQWKRSENINKQTVKLKKKQNLNEKNVYMFS